MYRITLLVLAILCFRIIPASAQNDRIHISPGTLTVEEIIEQVESQSRYSFAYDASQVDVTQTIYLENSLQTIEEVLEAISSRIPVDFNVHNRYLLINKGTGVLIARRPKPELEKVMILTQESLSPDTVMPVARSIAQTYQPLEPGKLPSLNPHRLNGYEESGSDLLYNIQYRQYNKTRNMPLVSIKTNLLYGVAAQAPNLAAEVQLTRRTTIELGASYNWYGRKGDNTNNKKLVHWIVRPEYRYWFCEAFNGHFVGGHAFYGQFNISERNLFFVSGMKKEYRYEGDGYGLGISYGYNLMLTRRWNVEFQAGVGYARLSYNKFECSRCSPPVSKESKNYIGPTRAGITLVYILN